jgi:hypothetical protein
MTYEEVHLLYDKLAFSRARQDTAHTNINPNTKIKVVYTEELTHL